MAKFQRAAVGAGIDKGEFLFAQTIQRAGDGVFVVFNNWIAAGRLIATIDERIQRQGIILGRGDLLFHQHAEDAHFLRGEYDWFVVA